MPTCGCNPLYMVCQLSSRNTVENSKQTPQMVEKRMNINAFAHSSSPCRSLPKLSSQDEEGGAGHGFGGTHAHFEPIPHDHDFCERVVINVSAPRLDGAPVISPNGLRLNAIHLSTLKHSPLMPLPILLPRFYLLILPHYFLC